MAPDITIELNGKDDIVTMRVDKRYNTGDSEMDDDDSKTINITMTPNDVTNFQLKLQEAQDRAKKAQPEPLVMRW